MITKSDRTLIPLECIVTDWSSIEPWYRALLGRALDSIASLKQYLYDWSELEIALE